MAESVEVPQEIINHRNTLSQRLTGRLETRAAVLFIDPMKALRKDYRGPMTRPRWWTDDDDAMAGSLGG